MEVLTLEQAILETARSLSLDKQQTLLDFAEFLAQRSEAASLVQTTLQQELLRQSVDENGWPLDFFETVIGGWVGEPLERAEQGDYDVREPLF
jgi:hypothetical protein